MDSRSINKHHENIKVLGAPGYYNGNRIQRVNWKGLRVVEFVCTQFLRALKMSLHSFAAGKSTKASRISMLLSFV